MASAAALYFCNVRQIKNRKLLLHLFLEAVNQFGLPSKVRSDFGTENVGVAEYMLNHQERGPNRGSMLTGRSVHKGSNDCGWK